MTLFNHFIQNDRTDLIISKRTYCLDRADQKRRASFLDLR